MEMKETHRIYSSLLGNYLHDACIKSYLIFQTLYKSKKNLCTYINKYFVNKNELLF